MVLTRHLRRRNTHKRLKRDPKSFGYLIDLLNTFGRFLPSFGYSLLGISACDRFLPAFDSGLVLLAVHFHCMCLSSFLYHTLQAFSEHAGSSDAFCFWFRRPKRCLRRYEIDEPVVLTSERVDG